ncbi:MAG TPA: hypothetical protein VGD67_28395 [Pseudonocardiaceae bacterium]
MCRSSDDGGRRCDSPSTGRTAATHRKRVSRARRTLARAVDSGDPDRITTAQDRLNALTGDGTPPPSGPQDTRPDLAGALRAALLGGTAEEIRRGHDVIRAHNHRTTGRTTDGAAATPGTTTGRTTDTTGATGAAAGAGRADRGEGARTSRSRRGGDVTADHTTGTGGPGPVVHNVNIASAGATVGSQHDTIPGPATGPTTGHGADHGPHAARAGRGGTHNPGGRTTSNVASGNDHVDHQIGITITPRRATPHPPSAAAAAGETPDSTASAKAAKKTKKAKKAKTGRAAETGDVTTPTDKARKAEKKARNAARNADRGADTPTVTVVTGVAGSVHTGPGVQINHTGGRTTARPRRRPRHRDVTGTGESSPAAGVGHITAQHITRIDGHHGNLRLGGGRQIDNPTGGHVEIRGDGSVWIDGKRVEG